MPDMTTAVAVISIIEKLGGWSVGGFLAFVVITPAIFIYLAARIVVKAINGLSKQIAASEKESVQRFQAFRADYDNNIKFVEAYSSLASRLEDTLRRNTIAITKLVDRIDIRKEAGRGGG